MDRPSPPPGERTSPPRLRRLPLAGENPYPFASACAIATCVLVPGYVVRWHVGPFPTTLLESAVLLTVAVFVIESVRMGIRPVWRTPVTMPAIVFLLAGAISIVVAPDHRAALGLYRAYLIEPVAFSLVLVNVVSTPIRAMAIVAGLAAGGALAGVANSAVVLNALRHHTYDVVNNPPVVIYNTANAVALYLVPLVAFAGAVALHWRGRRERWVAGAFLVVGCTSVVLSFSRGGYLALLVVLVALALTHRRRWLFLIGGAVVAIALMQVPSIGRRVMTDIDLTNGHNTLVGRFHLWSVTLQMLSHHVVFGAGLSGFATAIGPYWNPTNIDRYTYPHNIVLNFWTETGLLGVFAFGWILVTGFVYAWRGWRQPASEWRAIHLGVLLALVAVVVHGLVDVPYWKNDLSLEFWALLSLVLARPALLVKAAFRAEAE
jgi:O-antigen ligase